MSSRRSDGADRAPVVITVKVKPRSAVSTLARAATGEWVARVRSSPVDGKANAELIALVAEHFECPKSTVTIQAGASGRTKLVKVSI